MGPRYEYYNNKMQLCKGSGGFALTMLDPDLLHHRVVWEWDRVMACCSCYHRPLDHATDAGDGQRCQLSEEETQGKLRGASCFVFTVLNAQLITTPYQEKKTRTREVKSAAPALKSAQRDNELLLVGPRKELRLAGSHSLSR
jgi:hypothetical protein